MTDVVKQRDLFTRRFRTVAPPDPSEAQIQISLVERLRWQIRDDVIWFHVPNGEERDKRVAAKLKAFGVLPGVADLIFIFQRSDASEEPGPDPSGNQAAAAGLAVLFLELKAPKRKMSDVQNLFAARAQKIKCFYECANNIDFAWSIVESYGLIKRKGASL